jgi:hypothetical protein
MSSKANVLTPQLKILQEKTIKASVLGLLKGLLTTPFYSTFMPHNVASFTYDSPVE